MHARDLFFDIKRKLHAAGLPAVVSYENADQSFPYIWAEILDWQVDHPTQPQVACAKVRLTLLSRYQGSKEMTEMRHRAVQALEQDGQMRLVAQHGTAEKSKATRQTTLEFKAKMRVL